jgi:glycine/D-amino acid oxidase-like deaminating enzyme
VVVIGSGVAGSAIAAALCQQGYRVVLVFREAGEGSSFTNQKWNHSGLLYPAEGIARQACQEFLRGSLLRRYAYVTPAPARFLALERQTLERRQGQWLTWNVRGWGLLWRPLDEAEYRVIEPLGGTRAVGGFEVPDRVVDFPALIGDLREQVRRSGGVVARGTVRQIRVQGRRVTGVSLSDGQSAVGCSLCVLAGGAWSASVLRESGIDPPDLILRRCVVLEYDGELVPGLTTCLDAGGRDGAGQDVTLVPFRGKTLAAGAGFTEVADADALPPDHAQAERVRHQLARCFPALRDRPSRIVTCVKAEKRPAREPDVSPEVYGPEFHGVTGLLIAIPGKASFMFELADRVLNKIDGRM